MKDLKSVTIETYDKTARQYAEKVKDFFLEKEAEKFLSYLSKGNLILDLGCGSGRDAKIFTEKGYRVIGVDLSERLLDIARKDAPKAEFRLMDIINLDFDENHFDGVWAVASLLHMPKKEILDLMAGVYKSLKPNGIFYVSVKKGEGEVLKPDERYGGSKKFWSFFQRDEIVSFLESSKFIVIGASSNESSSKYATNPWIKILCRK